MAKMIFKLIKLIIKKVHRKKQPTIQATQSIIIIINKD